MTLSMTRKATRLSRSGPAPWGIALLLSAVLASGCSRGAEAKADLPKTDETFVTPVRVTHPLTKISSSETELVGSIRSKHMVTLSAKLTAQITHLKVEVGDRVKKGQVLVRLDTASAAAALANASAAERLAKAGQDHAKLEIGRADTLHEHGALNDSALDGAKTQYDVASAQRDQARAAVRSTQQIISDATLVAPFDGVVSARFASEGETATAMPPARLLTIVDPDALEVRLSVPEPLVGFVHVGDTIKGTVSPSGKSIEVRVTALSSTVDERSRTVEVLADVEKSDVSTLLVGMLVTLDASTSPNAKGPFLPATAVRKDDKGTYVVIVKGEVLERVDVKAVPLNPGVMAVPEGISSDQDVAIDETGTLKAGDRVRAIDAEKEKGA